MNQQRYLGSNPTAGRCSRIDGVAEIRRFEEDLETNGAEAHYRGNLYLVNTGQEYDEKTILP